MAWYNYPITQGHAVDDGIDIGTPNNTPVYMPFDGQVIDSSYHTYGGQVFAAIPGKGFSEGFIHLNEIFVHPGDTIKAGEIIGTTGGGLGDLILHNGIVQPAQNMSWYMGASTGYHTELDFFMGETMNQVNQAWGNPKFQYDPTTVYKELQSGAKLTMPTGGTAPPPGGGGTPPPGGVGSGGLTIPFLDQIFQDFFTQLDVFIGTETAMFNSWVTQQWTGLTGGLMQDISIRAVGYVSGLTLMLLGTIDIMQALNSGGQVDFTSLIPAASDTNKKEEKPKEEKQEKKKETIRKVKKAAKTAAKIAEVAA